MKTTYIKKDISSKFVTFNTVLNKKLYRIGKTISDYENNLWVPLSKEQLKFHASNPNASVYEVFNMSIDSTKDIFSLEEVKNKKIEEILKYDMSPEINVFFINGMPYWLDKIQRSALFTRFEAEEIKGKTETSIWLEKMHINVSIEKAKDLIYVIENYAAECYDTTHMHIFNIQNFSNTEEIEHYDYKCRYPEKLNFTIC